MKRRRTTSKLTPDPEAFAMLSRLRQSKRKGPKKVVRLEDIDVADLKGTRIMLMGMLCSCTDNFVEWVSHNLPQLSLMFACHAMQEVAQGNKLPAIEDFESFCESAHLQASQVVAEVESETATKH